MGCLNVSIAPHAPLENHRFQPIFGLSLVSYVSPMFTFRRPIFVFRLCHVNIAMA